MPQPSKVTVGDAPGSQNGAVVILRGRCGEIRFV
jgi:hypothetical protein